RRLRCGLLQLQVGGSAGGGCLLPVRRKRHLRPGNRPGLPAKHPGKRRLPGAHGTVQSLPGPRTAGGCPAETNRHHGRSCLIQSTSVVVFGNRVFCCGSVIASPERFIAGAVCPLCAEMDKITFSTAVAGDHFRECLAWCYTDALSDQLVPGAPEIDARVNKKGNIDDHP